MEEILFYQTDQISIWLLIAVLALPMCSWQSTTSQILNLYWIIEGVHVKNLEETLLFINFSKAFYSLYMENVEQIVLAHGLPKENVTAIIMFYKTMKAMVCSPDDNNVFFLHCCKEIHWHLFIIHLDYVLWTSIDLMKENVFTLKKSRNRQYPAEIITDVDSADDLVLLENAPAHTKSLLHRLE